MEHDNQLVRIYTGHEITILRLKGELENYEIPALIENRFQSGVAAGFVADSPSAVDLYVEEKDAPKAQLILNDLLQDEHK